MNKDFCCPECNGTEFKKEYKSEHNIETYCTKCGKIGDSSQAPMPNFTNTPGVINHLDAVPCIDPLRFTCVEGSLATSPTNLDEAKKVTTCASNTIGVVDKIYAGSTINAK